MPEQQLSEAAGLARRHWRDTLARVGLVAEGIFNVTVGLLVVQLALGQAGEDDAGPEGAAEQIAQQPFGQILLVVLILGLLCLVAWRAVQLFTGDEVEGDGLDARVKYGGMVVTYSLIILVAGSVLLQGWGADTGDDNGDAEAEATAFILDWPAGEYLVGAVGLGFIGVGLLAMWTYGVQGEFMKRIDRDRAGTVLEHKIRVVGRIGYVGRSMVNVVIGSLLIIAARDHDPDEAGGMSESLANLADEAWGQALLLFIALGFFLYAVLRFIEARYRKASEATEHVRCPGTGPWSRLRSPGRAPRGGTPCTRAGTRRTIRTSRR